MQENREGHQKSWRSRTGEWLPRIEDSGGNIYPGYWKYDKESPREIFFKDYLSVLLYKCTKLSLIMFFLDDFLRNNPLNYFVNFTS